MKVGELIKRYEVNLRTGADRRLCDANRNQKIIGFIAETIGSDKVLKFLKKGELACTFVFFDTEGQPRGFVNGWQDVHGAIDMIEKLRLERGYDKFLFRKMKLMIAL